MPSGSGRWMRRLSIAIAATLVSLTTRLAWGKTSGSDPLWLRDETDNLEVLVYPPVTARGAADKRARPITVMLHGMCDEPENECPYFADAVTPRSWLVCPRARLRCEGGGSIWHYGKRHDTVERSVALVHERFPDRLDETRGRTLIGFSLGAIFGMDIAHRAAGRYPRVVLIGAKVTPWASLLERQGVERIVFAAGDYDMMKWHMVGAARRADRHGVRAQFVSFGKVGHWFPEDLTARLNPVLDWVEGSTEAQPPEAAPRARAKP